MTQSLLRRGHSIVAYVDDSGEGRWTPEEYSLTSPSIRDMSIPEGYEHLLQDTLLAQGGSSGDDTTVALPFEL